MPNRAQFKEETAKADSSFDRNSLNPEFMIITLKVKPHAKEEKIVKIDDFNFLIWVKEPPIENRANRAVLRVLADYLNVAQSDIRIISGYNLRNKIIEIT